MSEAQQKKRKQIKLSRLEIVSELYKRGYSIRKIRSDVMKRLDLGSYSTKTVHSDIQTLLKDWRLNRLDNMDYALQLELERIDDTVRELWEQWEKSKQAYTKTTSRRKGAPVKDSKTGESSLKTFQKEETETEVGGIGNVAYITEIRQQLAERRKLLGLYATTRTEVTGDFSFSSFLIESGMLDDAERQ